MLHASWHWGFSTNGNKAPLRSHLSETPTEKWISWLLSILCLAAVLARIYMCEWWVIDCRILSKSGLFLFWCVRVNQSRSVSSGNSFIDQFYTWQCFCFLLSIFPAFQPHHCLVKPPSAHQMTVSCLTCSEAASDPTDDVWKQLMRILM